MIDPETGARARLAEAAKEEVRRAGLRFLTDRRAGPAPSAATLAFTLDRRTPAMLMACDPEPEAGVFLVPLGNGKALQIKVVDLP